MQTLAWMVAVLVGLLAFAYYSFLFIDMYWSFTGNEAIIREIGEATIKWIQAFPLWRKVIEGVWVGAGLLGAIATLARLRIAGRLLAIAFVLMIVGFVGHDLIMADGARLYGQQGVLATTVWIVLAFIFAATSYAVSRRG